MGRVSVCAPEEGFSMLLSQKRSVVFVCGKAPHKKTRRVVCGEEVGAEQGAALGNKVPSPLRGQGTRSCKPDPCPPKKSWSILSVQDEGARRVISTPPLARRRTTSALVTNTHNPILGDFLVSSEFIFLSRLGDRRPSPTRKYPTGWR